MSDNDIQWVIAIQHKMGEVLTHIARSEYDQAEQCANEYLSHLGTLLEDDVSKGLH